MYTKNSDLENLVIFNCYKRMHLHYPNGVDFEVKENVQRTKTKLEVVANVHNVGVLVILSDRKCN